GSDGRALPRRAVRALVDEDARRLIGARRIEELVAERDRGLVADAAVARAGTTAARAELARAAAMGAGDQQLAVEMILQRHEVAMRRLHGRRCGRSQRALERRAGRGIERLQLARR